MIEQITPETGRAPDEAPRSSGGETLYCEHCGGPNAADSRFCVDCGSALAPPGGVGPGEHVAAAKATPPRRTSTMCGEVAPAVNATPYKPCGCCVGTVCAHDHLAGFGSRLLAFLIDAILIGIVSSLLRGLDLRAMASLADAVYFVAFWSTTGQTVGMRALRIKVVHIDGQPLWWGTGLVRYAGYVLSVIPLGLGLLWIIWDRNKQGWHDKIAQTVVVRTV